MTWAPFLFAFVLGLAIAGALYVGYMWPAPEPEPVPEPPQPAPEPDAK